MSGRTELKSYFNTGDVPTEAQFADLIDSVKVVAEAEPWFYPVQIGRAMAVDNTWADVAQFLLPRPEVDWMVGCVGLIGSTKDLELQIVDSHAVVILMLELPSQVAGISTPFQEVDLAQLQNYGDFVHLILQARVVPDASPGTMEVHHLAFTAHP